MTIDRVAVRSAVGAMGLALVVWFGGMAGLALVVEPDTVVVFGRAPNLMRATVAADASLVAAGRGFVTLRRQSPGWVRRLYASGAWFVWPVVARGCGRA